MPGGLMPTYNDRGFPLYGTGETFPGWAAAFNSQSNLLATALDTSEANVQDEQSFATIAELPDPADAWPGRIVMIEENDMLYLFDGTGWYAFAGKSPYFYGSRSVSAVGTGASPQGYLTATDYSRGITRTGDTLTFATVGIYEVNQSVVWESNTSGQRNLGIDGTDITVLGPPQSAVVPAALVAETQMFTTDILVTAPGATARPFVTHNTGVALDVHGTAYVRWVSA